MLQQGLSLHGHQMAAVQVSTGYLPGDKTIVCSSMISPPTRIGTTATAPAHMVAVVLCGGICNIRHIDDSRHALLNGFTLTTAYLGLQWLQGSCLLLRLDLSLQGTPSMRPVGSYISSDQKALLVLQRYVCGMVLDVQCQVHLWCH